jgi:pentatricopeptide repeat protein
LEPRPHFSTTTTPIVARRETRRTFFGVFSRPPRAIKQPIFEPGLNVLGQWRTALLDGTRPPKRAQLVEAFRSFFAFKVRHGMVVNSSHAAAFRLLMQYLVQNLAEEQGPGLQIKELIVARHALLKKPDDSVDAHQAFSRDIYHEIRRLRQSGNGPSSGAKPRQGKKEVDPAMEDLELFTLALTQYGATAEAAENLSEYCMICLSKGNGIDLDQEVFLDILRGYSREKHEEGLIRELDVMKEMGFGYGRQVQEIMTLFYTQRAIDSEDADRVRYMVKNAKVWSMRSMAGDEIPSAATLRAVLDLGLKLGDHSWIQSTFSPIAKSSNVPEPAVCDVLLQWTMRTADLGEAKQLMEELSARLAEDDTALFHWPTSDTAHALLEVAVKAKNETAINEVLSTFQAKDVSLDAKSHILLVSWQIDIGDPRRALKTYVDMRATQAATDEDIPMMNRLIRDLCGHKTPPFQAIFKLLHELEERAALLGPETIIALCQLCFQYESYMDALDILSVNLAPLSATQQTMVQDALLQNCLDRERSTARVWDTYQVLRQLFPLMEREPLRQLMRAFFQRHRPDMAINVLKLMRKHAHPESRPDAETYIEFFESMGVWADDESLASAYNMFKLDTKVRLSTRIYNALMIAYGNSGRTGQALDFWTDLKRSAEGPSYESLEIIFAACARRFRGDFFARKIWKKLHMMDVGITPEIYMRYVA